ncbi:hypothetical protein D3C81_1016390 [compost metagenome]
MPVQGDDGAFGQPGVNPKRQRSTHQHLVKTRRDHLRETLAAEIHRPGHARPALLDEQLVGLAKAIRRGHFAILQVTALLVTVAVERCHHLGGKTRGLFEHAVNGLAIQAVAQLLAMAAHVKQLVQNKTHIAQWCLILHTRPSPTLPKPLPAATNRVISAAGFQCSPCCCCNACRRCSIVASPWASAQFIGPPTCAGKP